MHHFLEKASAMYYNGSPILSDEEFDALQLSIVAKRKNIGN